MDGNVIKTFEVPTTTSLSINNDPSFDTSLYVLPYKIVEINTFINSCKQLLNIYAE